MKKTKKQTELEKEFKELVDTHSAELNEKKKVLSAAMEDLVETSEKYGIPFINGISSIRNKYTPESFMDKYSTLDVDFLLEVLRFHTNTDWTGWQHSAVC